MIKLFIFSICISFTTLAIYVCIQWQGLILHRAKTWLDKIIPPVVRKPLYDCLICMSSVWTITFWLLIRHRPEWLMLWAVLIVAGMNTLICLTLEKLTDYGC